MSAMHARAVRGGRTGCDVSYAVWLCSTVSPAGGPRVRAHGSTPLGISRRGTEAGASSCHRSYGG
ncbi:hypothetical protein C882_2448 [Caenispirillum salinarum AK4]|uniref:Uncharacterized protein n=1 Tax=Caenispirillum salinarum AK4 TaxID=1238182 RepID=K9H5J7_9PROT|nr:hypothetical protein C882_2448 [Caenispirillum salinarum AK4]